MNKNQIKNSRNTESDRFLLDIQMHNSIGNRNADELTEGIANYILEREKVESCTIYFISPVNLILFIAFKLTIFLAFPVPIVVIKLIDVISNDDVHYVSSTFYMRSFGLLKTIAVSVPMLFFNCSLFKMKQ